MTHEKSVGYNKALDFFKEKVIMNKNLTICYFNCDSLQFPFLKNIWRVLFLTNDVLLNRREYEYTSCDTDLDINDCL